MIGLICTMFSPWNKFSYFSFKLIFLFLLIVISFPVIYALEDSWILLEPMPTARSSAGVAVVSGKIYVIGGYNGNALNTNEMYDPVTDSWITKTSMPTARYAFGIGVVNDKIYVIGGNVRYDTWITTNEVYDPATDTWETKAAIPKAGMAMSANVVNGQIYLMGGLETYYFPWNTLDENQVYDPVADFWTKKAPILNPVFDYGSAVVDDRIYVIGGRDINLDPEKQNYTQIYEPERDLWSYGSSIPVSINTRSVEATIGVLAPKQIHLFKSDIHYIFDLESETWNSGTSMLIPRIGVSIAVLNDKLYAIGGYDGENYRNDNELYTPSGYIPEFPSWMLPSFFIIGAIVVIVFKNRLHPS